MTELREQLLTARDEYRSVRYPGDLAGEVLAPAARRSATPPPWGMRTFLLRLTGVAIAAVAVVALVLVRPPEQPTTPVPLVAESDLAPESELARAPRRDDSHAWRFPPDLTFASAAAERVKTVATRVQMRMTLPYRDLRMPTMPELPSLPWPDWTRGRDRGGNPETPADSDTSPPAGPSTQQAA
jgi:hypothetical protein